MLSDRQVLSVRVFNGLANGMGGIDWGGLELLTERFGIDDVEALVDDLLIIKYHDPEKKNGSRDAEH